jgi:hypothetical protein
MRLKVNSFTAPKAGNSKDECEDAYWAPPSAADTVGCPVAFAVADGATESAYAGLWAKHLVEVYRDAGLWQTDDGTDAANGLGPDETARLHDLVQHRARQWSTEVFSKSLPWFAVEKAQHGAFSTLLGLTLVPHPDGRAGGRWHALGIGDSCLIHLQKGKRPKSWPLERAEAFGDRPRLLSTNPAANARLWSDLTPHHYHGEWRREDRFLLLTDAVAHWFLSAEESGKKPWSEIRKFAKKPGNFQSWLNEERESGRLRNDDVTLVIIQPV